MRDASWGGQPELPPRTRALLVRYRTRMRTVTMAAGVLAAVFAIGASFLSVFVSDRLWDTPGWLRTVCLAAGISGMLVWLPLTWYRWVWQTRDLANAARLVRRRLPDIGDQLLSVVELASSPYERERSESLWRAAMRQVDESLASCDLRDAVPAARWRSWASAVAAASLLVLAALAAVPSASTNAFKRWSTPWHPVPRYTFAQFAELPEEMVVPRAEPFFLTVVLGRQSVWSPPSAVARCAEQQPVRAVLREGRYIFSMPPRTAPGVLKVAAGDARGTARVIPVSRPELATIVGQVRLPDYLQRRDHQTSDLRSGSISLVPGSRIAVEARATRPLSEASLDDRPVDVEGTRMVAAPLSVVASTSHRLMWRDRLGLTAKEPYEILVRVVDDEPPRLSCDNLAREQVLLSTDTLTLDASVRDDFGVRFVGIEWSGIADSLRNPDPARGELLLVAGTPETREIDLAGAFSAERERVPPQTLELRLFAEDFKPGRGRVYSPVCLLHVLSPEDHVKWLADQLQTWLDQAREIYELEQQLAEANRTLGALSPEELDREENRVRMREQAAAELANARRLGTATEVGEQLIRQAVRNEQFQADTLESCARMVQELKHIADDRMPAVSKLLAAAAAQQAVEEQAELLSRFTAVTDELDEILSSLDGGTFVNRLKASSRRQWEIAEDLNTVLSAGFGLAANSTDESVRRRVAEIAARQFAHGDELYQMLDELEAHARRVEHVRFDQVLQEMRRARVVPSLHEVAQGIQANRSGRSLAHAEFWADSLDRWAEELIERDQPLAGPDAAQPAAGLPAAFVLDIMRVVAQEVDLREETRQADRARPGRQDAEHAARTTQLAELQTVIAQRVKHVADSLRTLPEAESRYFHEIAALTRAEQVMREAREYLAAGDAGTRTIAAETETIELLHQTRRGNPKTGSGSGSAPGLGGGGGAAQAALASLGAGSAEKAQSVPRSPQHATGTSGRRFPAEFRSGLDAFFDALDKALE